LGRIFQQTQRAGDDAVGKPIERINFRDIEIWIFGICLRFGFWCLEFFVVFIKQLILNMVDRFKN